LFYSKEAATRRESNQEEMKIPSYISKRLRLEFGGEEATTRISKTAFYLKEAAAR
jgi:hypothetical protein